MPVTRDNFVEHMLDFYEKTGSSYDTWSGGVHAKAAARLAELATVNPGERALDVGCGTGLVTRRLGALRTEGGLVVGVDISRRLLTMARTDGGDMPLYVRMRAEQLGFRRRRFDVATIGLALAYMRDPDAALAEVRRVLRKGGRLAVSCQRRRLSTPAQRLFFASLAGLSQRHPLRIPRLPEDRAVFGEPQVLTEMLKEAGFEDVRLTQMVTGGSAANAHEWTELMIGAGPYPHSLLSVLGPRPRAEFEAKLDEEMRQLGEDAYRYHHAFTFAVASRP